MVPKSHCYGNWVVHEWGVCILRKEQEHWLYLALYNVPFQTCDIIFKVSSKYKNSFSESCFQLQRILFGLKQMAIYFERILFLYIYLILNWIILTLRYPMKPCVVSRKGEI